MNRRDWLLRTTAGTIALCAKPARLFAAEADSALAKLEMRHGGRLGVAILDTGNDRRLSHRADERFLMCSTFKLLLVAAVLERIDAGKEELGRVIKFGKDALLEYAPSTRLHAGKDGMTVGDLCDVAITLSDNTAANLLLQLVGGPAAVTAYARGLGDTITRLDRIEPELNRPDGERDTTMPAAMLADLRTLALSDALAVESRDQLMIWLQGNLTGAMSVRKGLPATWRVGDKTGQGTHANNDVVIAWPPARKPVLISAYYAHDNADADERKAVLAEVGRIAATI